MHSLALHLQHERLRARFTAVNGYQVVADYADPTGESAALRQSAGLADLSFRGRLCVVGPDRVRFLNGQVTNDVQALRVGRGCYAALVTHKGRMISDLCIHRLADELLLDCEPGSGQPVAARLAEMTIADDVTVVDVSASYGLISIQGPAAAQALAAWDHPVPSEPWQHVTWSQADAGDLCLVNHPRFGTAGYDCFAPMAALPALWDQFAAAVEEVGGTAVGWDAMEVARVEAGIPRYGADMDAHTLPAEAGLDTSAVSFSKGCYTGQEVIARIRTYGHVNWNLRGLRLEHGVQVLPKPGDKILDGDLEIGRVTSAVTSVALRTNIALGYVRREADRNGRSLTVRSAAGDQAALLVDLPFAANP
jgi:folate-binding protein YgfZ